jgi:hypothetical protein
MAKFNPETNLKQPEAPNFTGASRGQTGDKSLGILFEGLGDLATGAGQVYDRTVKKNIRNDVTAAFDQNLSLFTEANKETADGVSVDIANTKSAVSRLRSAFEAGTLSDTDYYSRLDVEMRKIRAKYPSRREDVDNIIQDVTGVRPPNAARKARMAEFKEEERKAASQQAADQRWIDDNHKTIYQIFGDEYDKNPGKFPLPFLKQEVARFNADLAVVLQTTQRANSIIAVNKANSQLAVEGAQQAMDAQGANKVQQVLGGAANILGVSFNQENYKARLKELQEQEGGITPDQLKEYLGRFNLLKADINASLTEMFMQTTEITNQDGTKGIATYGEILGSAKQAEMIKNYMAPVDVLIDLLTNGEYGAAAQELAANKLAQERITGAILKAKPEAAIIGGMREFSPAMADAMEDEMMQNTDAEPLTTRVLKSILSGTEGFDREFQIISEDETWAPQDREELANALIDMVPSLLRNPTVPVKEKAKIIKRLFGDPKDTLFKYIKRDQHIDLFQQLAGPDVAQAVQELGNEELTNMYVDWVINKFKLLPQLRGAASTVWKGLRKSGFAIQYNPKTRQFDQVSTEREPIEGESRAQRLVKGAMDRTLQNSATEALEEINSGLRVLAPALDILGEERATPEMIQRIIQLLGT